MCWLSGDASELELVALTALTALRISRLWQNGCHRRASKCSIPWQVVLTRKERSGGGSCRLDSAIPFSQAHFMDKEIEGQELAHRHLASMERLWGSNPGSEDSQAVGSMPVALIAIE